MLCFSNHCIRCEAAHQEPCARNSDVRRQELAQIQTLFNKLDIDNSKRLDLNDISKPRIDSTYCSTASAVQV